jgi:hypothetical protein
MAIPNLSKLLREAHQVIKQASAGKLLKGAQRSLSQAEMEVFANLLKASGYGVTAPGESFFAPTGVKEEEISSAVQQEIERQEKQERERRVMGRLPGWPRSHEAEDIPARAPVEEEEEPLTNMQTEMIPVSSTNVHSIGFRYRTRDIGTLLVRFLGTTPDGHRGGPGGLYEYFDVPSILFERFKQAGSKGKFVWDELRIRGTISGHQYQYDLAGVVNDYVPRRAQQIFFRGPRGGLRRTEAYVPRAFNIGKIQGGRLKMVRQTSQLPFQKVGKSFTVHGRGGRSR